MQEELWQATQQSRRFHDERAAASAWWRDEAARQVATWYLDPHAGHDRTMLECLGLQDSLLDQAEEQFGAARQRLEEAAGHHARCASSVAEAHDALSQADEALRQADAAIGSCMAEVDRSVDLAHQASQAAASAP